MIGELTHRVQLCITNITLRSFSAGPLFCIITVKNKQYRTVWNILLLRYDHCWQAK